MLRVMVITFAVLGWSWYELSGGSDFVAGDHGVTLLARVEPKPGAAEAAEVEVARADITASDLTSITPMRVTRTLQAAGMTAQPAKLQAEPVLPADPKKFAALLEDARPLYSDLHLASATVGVTREAAARPAVKPEPARAEAPESRTDLRVVTGSRVNLRGGPSTGHAVLTQLLQGEHVEVVEDRGNGWVRLRALDDDAIGWMSANYLVASD